VSTGLNVALKSTRMVRTTEEHMADHTDAILRSGDRNLWRPRLVDPPARHMAGRSTIRSGSHGTVLPFRHGSWGPDR